MSILKANLKHLYQCRGFWWYYLVFAMFGSQLVLNKRDSFGWIWLGMMNLMAGVGISLLQKEILARPFSYCLPNYRPIPRRLILSFGVVFNLLLSLLTLLRKDMQADQNTPLFLLSIFSSGLILYLLVILCGLITRNTNLFPVVIVGLMATLLLPKGAMHNLAIDLPFLYPTFAIISLVVAYLLLQGESLARKFCGQTVQGFSSLNKASKRMAEQARYATWKDDYKPRINEFFLKRIRSCKDTDTARFIWSDLYLAFAPSLSRWKDILIAIVIASVASGYLATYTKDVNNTKSMILITIAVILSLAAIPIRLPLYSNTPPFAGRRQRFYGVMSVAGITTLLMILLLFVITATTRLLEQILPDLFAALPQMRFILLPLLAVPTILIFHVCIKNPYVKSLLIIFAFFLCAGLLVRSERVFTLMLIASACAWTLFILAMHHICTKRCLTR